MTSLISGPWVRSLYQFYHRPEPRNHLGIAELVPVDPVIYNQGV